MDELTGRVRSVIFEDSGFYIVSFAPSRIVGVDLRNFDKQQLAKVRGYFHGALQVKAGVPLKVSGKWTDHATYGPQFTVQSWEPWAESPADVRAFLHNVVDGFLDKDLVDAVVAHYDMRTFEVLEKSLYGDFAPERQEQIARGSLGWQRMSDIRRSGVLLQNLGVTYELTQRILQFFGSDAWKVLHDDPYRILEIPGTQFHKADLLASRMGVPASDVRRLAGAVVSSVRDEGKKGHLFVRECDVPGILPKEVSSATARLEQAYQHLTNNRSVRVVPDVGIYPMDHYRYEQDSARLLSRSLTDTKLHIDLDEFVSEFESSNKITLSEHQRQAIEKLLTSRVLVLTGLPGTGKTTVVRAFVRLFEKAKLTMRLMAPTGIAAKRLSAMAGHEASTIHRALRYDGDSWGYKENCKLDADAVIIDEMSMVDQELFYRLLVALPDDCTMVLVGDDAQLPSVGPGAVLRELVKSPLIPNVKLTKIFRQSVKGAIVLNAHRIYAGDMISVEQQPDSEFKFILMSDENLIADLIVEMASKLKAKDSNFQVLSPKYDGAIGVDNLNRLLQDKLNPRDPRHPQIEKRMESMLLREGDRVVVVKNDYDNNVYNGDVGKLTRITKGKIVLNVYGAGVSGTDLEVTYTEAEVASRLRLAYAVTVHKCQGSEFDTIILPVVQSQGWMLQRNLLYTAVTRARRRVWLLGEEGAILKAIRNDREMLRNTNFGRALIDHAGVS